MARPSLIVWDWDQTLWNGWEIHLNGLWYAADRLGLPRPSRRVVARRYSVPFAEHLAGLFSHDPQRVMALYIEFYHSRVKELAHLYDGIAEALVALKGHGYRLALFSDKRCAYGEPELELSGIGPMFESVLFREDGRAYKPDPQGLRQLLEGLGVPGQQALVVGDSHVDVECARRVGAFSGAALWGSVNRGATLARRPDYVWHTVAEMEAALIGGGV